MPDQPRRAHLDAGPGLHPMTLVDLFYFIVENHSDLLEHWDRSRHRVWCTCGLTPQAYTDPTCNRPVLQPGAPPCADDEPCRSPRQLQLDLHLDDEDIPF
jgi:hypothetical protein